MKKRHIFYIVYLVVTVICTVAALVLNPIEREFGGICLVPPTLLGDWMILISGVLIAAMLIFLAAVQIRKEILIKLKKLPPDVPTIHRDMRDASDMSLKIMTSSGIYNEKYDKAEQRRKEREEKQMRE